MVAKRLTNSSGEADAKSIGNSSSTGRESPSDSVSNAGSGVRHSERFMLTRGKNVVYVSPYGLHPVDDVPDGDLEKLGAEILARAIKEFS